MTSPFSDIAAYTRLERVTGLAVSPDGSRLIATVQGPDADVAKYVNALWELDPAGVREPTRVTWSDKGESTPAFQPDGTLMFTSARGDDAHLWALPAGGEARAIASYPGGVGGPVVAADAGTVLLSANRPAGSRGDDDGADRRTTHKERKVTAILHTGMPIRFWDHELGDVSPRLLAVVDGETRDLAPDAGSELTNAAFDISADGTRAVTTWVQRERGARTRRLLALIDVATGERRLLDAGPGASYSSPKLGQRLAVIRETEGSYAEIKTSSLQLIDVSGAADPLTIDVGDVSINEITWSLDGQTLYAAGDWHGRGAVLAVDLAGGVRRLASDAAYTSLCPAPDGVLYALRSTTEAPPAPVRIDTTATDQTPAILAFPAAQLAVPGRIEEVFATAPDGEQVRGWLCLPDGDGPAPLMVWIHGGPFTSYNAWSWRWSPWLAVARGYAVLLPDPALSMGYGPKWISRAWPHRAAEVWADVEALADSVLERDDLDANRTALLGASFGGYMTNWIAGHTDRFDAIVTHAGLWALDQQHKTTDASQWKTGLFGTPAEHPDWYAENSPNNFIDNITTPMLVVHGNRDYRVPVSEALRLWWDLVSHFDGEPEDMPHRFLNYTGENHCILSPANHQIWYETVLGFCDQHVLGQPATRSDLL